MNPYEFDGVFKAEVVYFLFSSPIINKRQKPQRTGVDYWLGLLGVGPRASSKPSSVILGREPS